MAVRVRTATTADTAAIRRVHVDSITGLGTESYTDRQVEAWAEGCETADYETPVESPEMTCLVAERDAIVGFAILNQTEPEDYTTDADAEVTAVYVTPDVAREGVGSKLYTELESRARATDIETLALSASRNAVSFYEAQGYERVREYDHEFSAHMNTGVTGTVVEMAKDLSE
jgi:putative acetyltransferase